MFTIWKPVKQNESWNQKMSFFATILLFFSKRTKNFEKRRITCENSFLRRFWKIFFLIFKMNSLKEQKFEWKRVQSNNNTRKLICHGQIWTDCRGRSHGRLLSYGSLRQSSAIRIKWRPFFWLIYLIFAYFPKKWSPGEAQVEPGPPLPHDVVNWEDRSLLLPSWCYATVYIYIR